MTSRICDGVFITISLYEEVKRFYVKTVDSSLDTIPEFDEIGA